MDSFAIVQSHSESLHDRQPIYVFSAAAPPSGYAENRAQSADEQERTASGKIVAASVHGRHLRRPALATALAVMVVLVSAVAVRQAMQTEGAQVETLTQATTSSAQPPSSQEAPGLPFAVGPARPDNLGQSETGSQPSPTARSSAASPAPVTVTDASAAPPPSSSVLPASSDNAVPAAAETPSDTSARAQPRPAATVARAAPLSAQASGRRATGAVRFSIVPWGEIYLDGKRLGAAPPLRDVALQPGLHRIEVRNPGFASHAQVIEIRAGDEIRIRHRFE
jgi:hypothetical protein